MPFKAVLFDFDETLADTLPGRAATLRALLTGHLQRDIPEAEALALIRLGSSIEAQLERYLNEDVAIATTLGLQYRELYYAPDRATLPLYHGVQDTLTALRAAGVPTGIVTSRYRSGPGEDHPHWGVLRELRQIAIADSFSVIVGYEDTERHKPDPDPFLVAIERLGVRPADIIALGDSPWDIVAAKAAGVQAAAALWGAYDRDALLAAGPDIVLEQPADLLRYV